MRLLSQQGLIFSVWKQDNAGRFECGYLKVTTVDLPIGFYPNAESCRIFFISHIHYSRKTVTR